MLKISEVYEKQIKDVKERPDGSEYVNFRKVYETRECLLNTEYIVAVHPHEFTTSMELDGNSFRSSEIIVVGSFDNFCRLLQENKT